MSRMVPLAGNSSYVVTADDGTLFHCQPHRIRHNGNGGNAGNGHGDESGEVRWVFIDTSHVRYVGPVYEGHVEPRALQRVLSEWWRSRRSSQLARVSGETSRDTSQF
jgi:hypothetical protein